VNEPHNTEPAARFVIAQSWWIASELARRNNLEVHEVHPGGGMYDVLAVARITPDGPSSERLEMNRVGSLHIFPDKIGWMTWSAVLATDDPHDVVHRVEAALGLHPSPKPVTSPRALTYRVIARILTSLVDDRNRWDARMGVYVTTGYGGGPRQEIDEHFPHALDHVRRLPTLPSWDGPHRHLWILGYALDNDLKAHRVAVLSDDAHLFLPGKKPTVDLMALYTANGRRLSATVHAALGRVLP
jgi:hypothetical protein